MTDKPASGRTYGDLLGDRVSEIVNKACDEHRAEFNDLRAKAKNGDEPLSYTRRTHHAIKGVLRNLRIQMGLDRAVIFNSLNELVERIAALEARPELKYLGTFEPGRAYREGSAVTDHGSLWIAKADTVVRPGANGDWQLAVKRGKDAR